MGGGSPAVVQFTRTPFANEVAVRVGEVWQGRIRFAGINRVDSMENMLLGLPASGNLPAWTVNGHSHAGVWAPEDANTYGLSVTLRGRTLEQGGSGRRTLKRLARLIQVACDL